MTVLQSAERFAAGTRPSHTRRWVALALLLVVAAVGVWAVWFSSWLVVREVRVVGAVTVSADSVRQAAAVPDRQPLARVDVDGIQGRVGAIPRVASVEVRRGWPNILVVVVTERQPLAVVPQGSTYAYVDPSGARFGELSLAPPGLAVVRTSSDDALASALGVLAALPADVRGTISRVSARTRDDVVLVLADGSTVQWGSADRSDRKVAVLRTLLPLHALRYDVSAPDLPTTQGRLTR
jgi:cell division protein FtsQ